MTSRWPWRCPRRGSLVVTRDGVRVQAAWRCGRRTADTAPLSRRRELRGLAKTVEAAEADRLAPRPATRRRKRGGAPGGRRGGRLRPAPRRAARAEARKDRHRIDADSAPGGRRSGRPRREAAVERLAAGGRGHGLCGRPPRRRCGGRGQPGVDRHGALGEMAGRVVAVSRPCDAAVATRAARRAGGGTARRGVEAAEGRRSASRGRSLSWRRARAPRAKARLLADTRQRTLADACKDEEGSLEAA
ncbi:MAG: hypothetical protein R3F43_08710 [bacterium]